MGYLGKRYLYNFLKEQGFSIPEKIKNAEYVKYRGREFLDIVLYSALDVKKIEIYCVRAKGMYISILIYDDNSDKYHEIERYSFHRQGDEGWQKTYERKKGRLL